MDKAEIERQQRISEIRSELSVLRELLQSEGYRTFLLPIFEEEHDRHTQGVVDLRPNYQRAEHVHAWHLTVRLKNCVPERIKALEGELGGMVSDSELLQTEIEK